MTEPILPEESESQEIGQYAVIAFNSIHPIDWRCTPTEGDSDAGLDMQIQLVNQRRYKGIFNAQIKGSRQKREDGKNRKLNADGMFFSQELSVSTLNYYLRVGNPVMLVFVDLTIDPNPRECAAYYLWLNEELDNLRAGQRSLDHLQKVSHTFRIPVTNTLDDNTDVLAYLLEQQEKRHALDSLYSSISARKTEPIATVGQLGSKFDASSIALDSVLAESASPWLEAPPDSIAGKLHTISNYLSVNNADLASHELNKIEQIIGEANTHEQAEYHFQKARLLALIGNHSEALPQYEEAHKMLPSIGKYHLGLLEEQLFDGYGDEGLVRTLLADIHDKTGSEFTRLKAKLYALLREFDRALELLGQEDDKDVFVVRALIALLRRNYSECAEYCEESLLREGLTKRQQLSLLAFRGRAFFNIGAGKAIDEHPGEIIPFSGLPAMDAVVLGKAWTDFKLAWAIASQLGYPADIEYLLDSSCILSVYFNDTRNFYGHLRHLAKIRPCSDYIQETLLKFAANLDDIDVVQDQLLKLPHKPSSIVHKIVTFYRQSNKNLVVQAVTEHKEELLKAKPDNLDIVLAIAAECADDLVRIGERDEFLNLLQTLPNGKAMLAVYEFISTVHINTLSVPQAIERLWKVYNDGIKDKQVLAQLFDHLDASDREESQKVIEVARDIAEQRQLTEREIHRLCRAWATKSGWEEIVAIATEALRRFDGSTHLRATKALALDELGRTPEALGLLEEIIEESSYDPYAFELYAQIAARCGLTNKSFVLFERLFENTGEKKHKARILRTMFILQMSLNPESARLLDFCMRYGEVNDREDEQEEGIFLLLFFAATNSEKAKPSDKQVKEFQQRLQEYGERFPRSTVVRSVSFNKDSPGDFLKRLEELSGMTEERRRWFQQNENLMKSGQLPVPFCFRPRALLNVSDLLYLWELAKHVSKDDRQYHLMMSAESYKYRNVKDYFNKTILIDDIAVLVLFDLDILDDCLSMLPSIAVAKSTISQYQLWSQNSFITPLCEKAKKIVSVLASHVKRIAQPSAMRVDEDEEFGILLEEKKRLMGTGQYIFYSDDALARIYVSGEDDPKKGICTIDIIELLASRGDIERIEAAKKYATLCKWNVIGVPVQYINVLLVLAPDMEAGLTTDEGVERLNKNDDFRAYIDSIWDIRKDYSSVVRDVADFIGFIITGSEGVSVEDSIVVALWYWWYRKVQFKEKGEVEKLDYLARSCWAVALNLSRRDLTREKHRRWSQRLWSIYKDTVQYVYGSEMDEDIEKVMYRRLAEFTATTERSVSDEVYGFLMHGLESETAEADIFSNSYGEAAIERIVKDE